jgi:hypothetical protein
MRNPSDISSFDEEYAHYWDEGRKFEDLQKKDPIPADEFVDSFKRKCLGNTRRVIKRDCFSYFSSLYALAQNLSYTEAIIVLLSSLGMTLFFCYYYYPDSNEPYRLAARIRFTIIGTAVLFPSTMLASETSLRREMALRRFGLLKGQLCQILVAFLTWRTPKIVMSSEWETKTFEITSRCAVLFHSLLLMPTIRDRHQYTNRGQAFARSILKERERLHGELIKVNFKLHVFVEDLKEQGLSPMESIRLFQYIQILFREFEQLWCIKVYRTPRAARAYVRTILTTCIMFYGYACFDYSSYHNRK